VDLNQVGCLADICAGLLLAWRGNDIDVCAELLLRLFLIPSPKCLALTLLLMVMWFSFQTSQNIHGPPLSYVQIDRLTTSWEDFGIPILELCNILWLVDNGLMAFCRWDIIAEKFGFMLIFGDVVFIPFTFSIQTSAYLNIIALRVFQLQQACRGNRVQNCW